MNVLFPYFISTEGQILDDGTTYRNYGPAQAVVPANGGFDPELAKKLMDEIMQKYKLDRVEPAMQNYVSSVGWGQMWSDIKQ